jgi:antitoxin (DNA-binding transcriptional repressor) of toxin-antitoxin stability system
MPIVNARQLHHETSALLDEVSKGKSFQIERNGKIIGKIVPETEDKRPGWDEIMKEVRALRKTVKNKHPNPVLAERARRRR